MSGKLIVIVGPTASGKSSLGIHLAQKFRGEIISADSRQVYIGMDIGTGKVTKAEQKLIPHHLLDIVSPKKQFTVADFKKLAEAAAEQIRAADKIPFVVGGTAFYVYALIDGTEIPAAKPNFKLRKSLEKKSVQELFLILKNLDPKRAKTIDKQNPARLIRAIEINVVTGKPVPALKPSASDKSVLILGIKKDPEELQELISKRVDDRIKHGLIREVKKLRAQKVSSKRLKEIGLTYEIVNRHLEGQLSKHEMANQIKIAEYQYSRRQMTWFKRDSRIVWIKNNVQAEKLVKAFLMSDK